MEDDFEKLKELVKNIYHFMNIEDLKKAIIKINEIEHKTTSCKNSLAYAKSENRRYRESFKKIKEISKKFM